MNLRSHPITELRDARAEGNLLFALDTGTDGADDVLYGLNLQEVINDVLFYHEFNELPEHWTLEEVDEETWRYLQTKYQ